MVEKRRHHRFMAMLDIRALPGADVPANLKLATLDVALGGARCAASVALTRDTRLQVSLKLVGGDLRAPRTIELDARVLRCSDRPGPDPNRQHEVALEFTRIDPEDRRVLQSYLNSL